MPIPALNPIVEPAKEATPFNDVWLGSWVITRRTPQERGTVSISEAYYNAELEQVHPDESKRSAGTISTNDLADAVENVPEVKAAYGALLAAAEPLRAYLIQKKAAEKAARLQAIEGRREELRQKAQEAAAAAEAAEPVLAAEPVVVADPGIAEAAPVIAENPEAAL